jgi:hypothetical protein
VKFFSQKIEPEYLIYFKYSTDDYILLCATEKLRNDIVDFCSDEVLFEFSDIKILDTNVISMFRKHGKHFTHKGNMCYMIPDKPASIIKEAFGIV